MVKQYEQIELYKRMAGIVAKLDLPAARQQEMYVGLKEVVDEYCPSPAEERKYLTEDELLYGLTLKSALPVELRPPSPPPKEESLLKDPYSTAVEEEEEEPETSLASDLEFKLETDK